MRKCTCGLTLGVGVCLCAIIGAETFEYQRPSAPKCEIRLVAGDFGPPPGCDDGSLAHNRMGWVTSVATSSGTGISTSIFINSPLVASTYRDSEDAAAEYDRGLDVTFWPYTPVKPTYGGSSGA
jgi:hypothetical protein